MPRSYNILYGTYRTVVLNYEVNKHHIKRYMVQHYTPAQVHQGKHCLTLAMSLWTGA